MLLVTGPTGNVGAELVRLLVEQRSPQEYRVAAHHPDRIVSAHGADTPVVGFSYDDRATWAPVLDGVDTLFLVFPLPKPSTARTWMQPFVDAAAASGCRHVVYLSVPAADRAPIPHRTVERHVRASGLSFTVLRASFFMQNLCRGISTHGVDVVERGEVFVPAGRGRTTFVDARDVARVALRVLAEPAPHAGATYTLTGTEALDFDAVAAELSTALERPVRYADPSVPAFWRRLRRRGVPRDVVAFMVGVYTLTRLGRNDPRTDDLAQLLGRPPTPFLRFAQEERWRWETRTWT